jgi:hypothetical protein
VQTQRRPEAPRVVSPPMVTEPASAREESRPLAAEATLRPSHEPAPRTASNTAEHGAVASPPANILIRESGTPGNGTTSSNGQPGTSPSSRFMPSLSEVVPDVRPTLPSEVEEPVHSQFAQRSGPGTASAKQSTGGNGLGVDDLGPPSSSAQKVCFTWLGVVI